MNNLFQIQTIYLTYEEYGMTIFTLYVLGWFHVAKEMFKAPHERKEDEDSSYY